MLTGPDPFFPNPNVNGKKRSGYARLDGNPLLKFIYPNRAVRSKLSNRAVRLRCCISYCSRLYFCNYLQRYMYPFSNLGFHLTGNKQIII